MPHIAEPHFAKICCENRNLEHQRICEGVCSPALHLWQLGPSTRTGRVSLRMGINSLTGEAKLLYAKISIVCVVFPRQISSNSAQCLRLLSSGRVTSIELQLRLLLRVRLMALNATAKSGV